MPDLNNLPQLLRMRNIFSPNIPIESGWPGGPVTMNPSSSNVNVPNPNTDWSWIHGGNKDVLAASASDKMAPPDPKISDVIDQLYTPSTTYSDLYSKGLETMPQRGKPSVKNRIAAGLIALGGDTKAAERAKYGDYDEKMADWETKMKFLQPAMTYERYGNATERSNAYQTAQTILRERQLAQTAERDRKTAESRDYANQIRAQVAKGGQFVVDDATHQGKIVYKDGSSVPVDITKLSPLDIEEAKQSNRMDLESERQDNRTELENMREASAKDIANLRSDITMELTRQRYELMGQRDMEKFGTPVQAYGKDGKPLDYLVSVNGKGEVRKIQLDQGTAIKPPPKTGTGAVQSETQKAQGVSNRALQIRSEHPEWSKYIKTDPKTGKFTGITTPGVFFGPNQDMYNKIYESIYQEPFTATAARPKTNTPAVKEPPKGAKPGGKWITTKFGDVYQEP